MRTVAERDRMRSLTCCGVSRTVCAGLGDASTSIPSRAAGTRHHTDASSLAGCMRIDDPRWDYTGRTAKSIRDFEDCDSVAQALLMWRKSNRIPRLEDVT